MNWASCPMPSGLETARTDLTPNEGFTAGSMSITLGGVALLLGSIGALGSDA